MRLKQKLAATLAVLLILLHGFPAFAITADELQKQTETVTIQDSGTPPEPSDNQNKPSEALLEQGVPTTENPTTPSDADTEQELPENDGSLTQPILPKDDSNPEDVPEIQTPSDASLETPITAPEEKSELPMFSAELVEDGENPGLYGTLDYIPEDTWLITVLYSFNGVDFYTVENSDEWGDREWDLSDLSEEDGEHKLTQLCVGANDHPFKAFQNGGVSNLYIKLEIRRDSGEVQTEPIKLSHEGTWPLPDMPQEFSAKIEYTFEGYVLKGTFTEFLPSTSCVRPMYSLDGEFYEPIGRNGETMDWNLRMLGTEEPSKQSLLQNQICAYSTDEPMKSYLKQGRESFYIKLQITTNTGDIYDTQAAVIERGTPQPPPENTTVSATFPASMIAVDMGQRPPYTYGKYHITVKENATPEDVYALLPDTLPIEVRIVQPDTSEVITSGIVECEVTWKEPPNLELTAGEAFTIQDASNELVVPAGAVVSTPLGVYVLPEAVVLDSPYARDEIRIVVNVAQKDEKSDISLTGNTNDDFVDGFVPLSLAFRLKPSGATSVKVYSYMEGDADWTEICELLSRRDINANPSAELYGYVDVLQPDEPPYADYLEGEIAGFFIGIIIEGGTFDGECVILPWPGEYTPPPRIPELDGSGGNENNAGSGDGSGNSTEGGQRPNLPGGEEPPVTIPPPGSSNPSGNSGTTLSTPTDMPENGDGSVSPIPLPGSSDPLDNIGTTPSTSADTPENGDGSVLPIPPLDPSNPPDNSGTTPSTPTDTPENGGGTVSPNLPLTGQGNMLVHLNEPDKSENTTSNPTEPESDKAAELPIWNEVKLQEQPQEKSDSKTVTRQTPDSEKTSGLPVAVAVLLLGSGSVAVGAAGTGWATKLLTILKKFLRRP